MVQLTWLHATYLTSAHQLKLAGSPAFLWASQLKAPSSPTPKGPQGGSLNHGGTLGITRIFIFSSKEKSTALIWSWKICCIKKNTLKHVHMHTSSVVILYSHCTCFYGVFAIPQVMLLHSLTLRNLWKKLHKVWTLVCGDLLCNMVK